MTANIQIDDNGNIAELLKLLPEVLDTFKAVVACKDYNLTAQWYDLEACYKLRGGGAFSTMKNNRWYQPKGAIPDAYIQGRKVWSRETVAEWLEQTDKTLAAYHKKYHTGASSPHAEISA